MTSVTVMPRDGDWTVADLADIPDDGLQYELADGVLLVSPAPRPRHQVVAGELYVLLRAACPPDLQVLFSPSVLALELEGGRHVEAGRAVGDQVLRPALPFPVELQPALLLD